MQLEEIAERLAGQRLEVFGGFAAVGEPDLPEGTRALLLIGPAEPGFWDHVRAAPEFADGAADPLDRWSTRVLGAIAAEIGAEALFSFGGPPWRPFIGWAQRSGRAWSSPVGLLVHDRAGLMVSYRGAFALPWDLALPAAPDCPCDGCAKPCLTACPVDALRPDAYDLAACHGFLDTAPGRACIDGGCQVRRACPVSQHYGRQEAQSAFHMRAFHR